MRCTVPVPMPSDLATRKLMASRSQQSRYLSVAGRDRDQTRHPPFAERPLRNISPGPHGSLRLDARELDHLGPLLGLVGDQLAKVDRGAGKHRAAQVGKPRHDLGIGESCVGLLVERVDDFGGRALRCAEAEPEARLIARHELAHGWKIRQRLRAFCARYCQRAQPAGLDVRDRRRHGGERHLHQPAEQIGERGCYAPIWHMNYVDAGHQLEQLARQMGGSSDTTRRHGELAGIALGIGDKLGNRFGRNRWIYYHDEGEADDAGDRRDVADKTELEIFVERRVDRVRGTYHEQRVAVRWRAPDRLGGNIAGSPWPALDDEWLAEPLRQRLTDQARDDVDYATGRKARNDPHRPRRIGLRPSDAGCGRKRGSARCQLQKLSAEKAHLNLPSQHSITSSARASSVGGTSRPSALAVLRLMTSSNFVGCSTGKSAGLAPLRILST